VYNYQRPKDKLGECSKWGIFLGKKGWNVYDLENGSICVSRDFFSGRQFSCFRSGQSDLIPNNGWSGISGVYDDEPSPIAVQIGPLLSAGAKNSRLSHSAENLRGRNLGQQ